MKENSQNKHNYNIHKSEGYLCIASVLYTILESENIIVDFNKLADYFIYNLPVGYNPNNLTKYRYTNDEDEWGVKLELTTINELFRDFNIPMTEKYIPINTLEDWSFIDTIKANISNHIVFGYDFSYLYENKESKIGHVSIINSLIDDKYIEILNPGPKYYGMKMFNEYDVYISIKRKKDGLWIISRNENN